MSQRILLLAGPTASGKSALGVALAAKEPCVIINADSMQVYRELPIITAQPSEEEKQQVPHRLYGVLPAAEPCSVGKWLQLVEEAIATTWKEGNIPLLVGGTGLYFKTLMQGIAHIPEIPSDVREAARAQLEAIGHAAFHAELAEKDPVSASSLNEGDTQRLLRAWEVVEHTGTPLSEWQKAPTKAPYPDAEFFGVFLAPPREENYACCNQRFLNMLENNALDEVAALDALGLADTLPAMRAHGVPELRALLHGALSHEEATTRAQANTRHYVKRQHTWFTHQMPELTPYTHNEDALRALSAACQSPGTHG